MAENIEPVANRHIMDSFDAIKRVAKKGTEYWLARDLQALLGYADWRNFEDAVNRARQACESSGGEPHHHFGDVTRLMPLGLGTGRRVKDIALTRYGAYLVAMNGEPNKPEIAAAQSYFAVQTRRQEIADSQGEAVSRITLRDRIKEDVKALNRAAKAAGVKRFGLFHDAGYRGLYGVGLRKIKERKGLSEKEDLLDRAGRAELAANDFRITQTEGKLRRDNVSEESKAMEVHHDVGAEVRNAIGKIGGKMPESLAPEPSIKKMSRKSTKELPPSQS